MLGSWLILFHVDASYSQETSLKDCTVHISASVRPKFS